MENPETELSSTSTSRSREIPSSQVLVLKKHNSQVSACAWSPTASILASVSEDIRIWPIYDPTCVTCGSRLQTDPIKTLVFTYVPGLTLGLNLDKRLKLVAALDWNDHGTLLATGSYDGQARIWNINRGDLQDTLTGHSAPIYTLKWNKDCSYILTGSSDNTAFAWALQHSKLGQRFNYHSGSVIDADWRDKDSFATCSTDHTIHVCKIGETRPINTFSGHKGRVNCVRWDPTGSLLASCSEDYTVKIWSMEQEQRVHNFMEHEKEVHVIRWSPTGTKILASGSTDSTVKLWDVKQGKLLYSLAGLWDPIFTLEFSPNGEYLASGANDQVNIWSVKDGQLIRSYKSSKSNGLACVCWNKEGDKIAAGFSDGTVHVLSFKM